MPDKQMTVPSVAHLQVQCPSTVSTQDLETEILLHMMKMYADSTEQASKQKVDAYANAFAVDRDGTAPPRCVVPVVL